MIGWGDGASEAREEIIPTGRLRRGQVIRVAAGELIPGDGDVIEGAASVDKSPITELAGDRAMWCLAAHRLRLDRHPWLCTCSEPTAPLTAAPALLAAAPERFHQAYRAGLMAFQRTSRPPVLPTAIGADGSLIGAAETGFDQVLTAPGVTAWRLDATRSSRG